MEIIIVEQPIPKSDLAAIAERQFGDLVKAVVDIERGMMAIGGELHADEEALLLEKGSRQEDLWGVNIYPAESGDERIEFDSMINIRLVQGNNSRSVEDPEIRSKIISIISKLIAS